jgi:predicted O-methyltransferase YrrM
VSVKTRLLASPVGQTAKRVIADQQARRITSSDPTVRSLLTALRAAAPDEGRWAERIEVERRRMRASTEPVVVEITDPDRWRTTIARSRDAHPPVLLDESHVQRTLGEVTRVTSKPPHWGRLLFRLVHRLAPQRCLELGTSVGISGSYLAAGLHTVGSGGRLITLEGQASSAALATRLFAELGLDAQVDVRTGWFDDTLEGALATLGGVDLAFIDGHHEYQPTLNYFAAVEPVTAPGGLLVFDDVSYWDKGMARAWAEVQQHPAVTGSVTIGSVGFAVVRGTPSGHHRIAGLALR